MLESGERTGAIAAENLFDVVAWKAHTLDGLPIGDLIFAKRARTGRAQCTFLVGFSAVSTVDAQSLPFDFVSFVR